MNRKQLICSRCICAFFPYIKIIGKETIAAKGLQLAKETLPELVFLDIDMPDMNGLQVADRIQSENFYSEIVFTTAHSHYAYEALGVEPLDFLTKPFCIADIGNSHAKIQGKKLKRKNMSRKQIALSMLNRLSRR